jgi:hypothetical protein
MVSATRITSVSMAVSRDPYFSPNCAARTATGRILGKSLPAEAVLEFPCAAHLY